MSILTKIFSGGAGEIIEKVGNTVDKFITTKEEKETLKIELQKLLNEHEAKMTELAQKELDSVLADKSSARLREVEIAKAGKSDYMMLATGATVLLSFIACVCATILLPIPEGNRELFIHLMGIVEGAFISGMVAYYYGTSKSSERKTELLAKK